ncbi:hypothetical protein FRX31_005263 [Thalictrum thalictroides]|uniref:Uncharacterized protein n=1 Tax=Thalictrum thalictroides TaxID=46969 RepID=A0A7J6X9H5_THATH|nr:hypothetical protein FRX31_005263 [Thalictrum thalictroides]
MCYKESDVALCSLCTILVEPADVAKSQFIEKGHIFVTVNLVDEVMSSIEVETNESAMNTLSGFPMADRRCGWGGRAIYFRNPWGHSRTGIGLSISVSLMKGEIRFVSELHIGSTFTFTAVFSSGHSNSDEYKNTNF